MKASLGPKLRAAGFIRSIGAVSWVGSVSWLGVLTLLSACGSGPAAAPPPSQPLGEERAVRLISEVLSQSGGQPHRGVSVPLEGGQVLDVDVGDPTNGYGVAYVTADERARLGKSLPPSTGPNSSLVVIRDSGGKPILVLDEQSYLYDDARGDDHEEPSAIAEGRLRRDVRDFLVHVAKRP
jgi:hypothetical protein